MSPLNILHINFSSYRGGAARAVYRLNEALNKNKLFFESKGGVMYMFPEYPNTAINYNLSLSPVYEIQLLEKHKFNKDIINSAIEMKNKLYNQNLRNVHI